MKRLGILIIVGILLGLNSFVPANSATIKAGTACKDLATIKTVNGQKFYCSYVLKTNTSNWQKVIPTVNKVKKLSTPHLQESGLLQFEPPRGLQQQKPRRTSRLWRLYPKPTSSQI